MYILFCKRKDTLMPVTFWGWLYAGTIILCWGAFLIVWSVGAIYNAFKAPTKQKQSGGWLFSWGIGVILVLVLVYFVPHGFWRSLGFDIFWLRIVGLIL